MKRMSNNLKALRPKLQRKRPHAALVGSVVITEDFTVTLRSFLSPSSSCMATCCSVEISMAFCCECEMIIAHVRIIFTLAFDH